MQVRTADIPHVDLAALADALDGAIRTTWLSYQTARKERAALWAVERRRWRRIVGDEPWQPGQRWAIVGTGRWWAYDLNERVPRYRSELETLFAVRRAGLERRIRCVATAPFQLPMAAA